MKLQRGITGFVQHDMTPPKLIKSNIQKLAYNLSNSTSYELKEMIDPKPSSNYYQLIFEHRQKDKKIKMVINSQYPFYAGMTTDSTWMNSEFIDLPVEIKDLFDQNFTYLNPEYLNKEFSRCDLVDLSKDEIDQIMYWNSKKFGEVIFNRYD